MAPIKSSVNGWGLVSSDDGEYFFQKRFVGHMFNLSITRDELADPPIWRLHASGGPDNSGRGGVAGVASSFDDAKRMAYEFMRTMGYGGRGSGHDAVVRAADRADWTNADELDWSYPWKNE